MSDALESAVTEMGIWREVTADCRINFLPFSIMFYVHKPGGMFGACSYRGVRVSALKAAHKAELGASVLTAAHTPSDAIQVLRSYNVAYRSRRTTLASLAERYGHTLYMEPHVEGGFVLKCVDLLEVWWRLENIKSTLAPFRHNMKSSFDYMDECYVKIVTHANKELSKPTVDTKERTFLLAKMISTCLEVRGSAQEPNESMETDTESVNRVETRQTTHTQEIENNEENNKRESNIMAPPKYFPKRAKPKGKENTVDNGNKGVKRTSSNDGIGGKRAKISEEGNQRVVQSGENTKKTDNRVIGESEGVTITDLVNKNDGVVQNKDKNKNKVKEKKNVDENNANNVDKVKKVVEATSNDQVSAKSKVTKDNLNTKDPKGDKVNTENVNVPKESVIPNQNAKTKETANANTNNTEHSIAGENKKQKSQENLKENNNIKKTTSNKNKVNQNKHPVPKNGNPNSNIAEKPKTVSKIPENTNIGAKNDNAKTNLDNNKVVNKTPENQNVETSKAVKNTKATDKTTDNKTVSNENAKIAKKSKPNSNLQTGVTKTNLNLDNANNNQASNNKMTNKVNNVENGGESTKTTLNKNKQPNIAKKSVASTKDRANTNVVSSKNKGSNTAQKVTENNVATSKNTDLKKSVASTKDKANTNVASSKNKESNTAQKVTENNVATSKNTDLKKSVASTKDKAKTNVASSKNKESNTAQKVTENNVATSKNTEKNTMRKATENNVAANKKKDNIVDVATGNVASLSRECSKDNLNTKKTDQNKQITANKNKPTLNILNKHNMPKKVAKPGNSGTFFKTGNPGTFLKSGSTGTFLNPSSTEKKDGGKITSKIPQKSFKTISDNAMKKNPLRVSPRKTASMFKSPTRPTLNHKIQKPSTNIPRLLKTSVTKTKS